MKGLLFFVGLFYSSYAIYYDAFHGTPITKKEVGKREQAGTLEWCTNEIKPCDPYEGRRVDGSCNNLNHPMAGSRHSRFLRMLPAYIDDDAAVNKAISGKDLPAARFVRTSTLADGKISSQKFTHLATGLLLFMTSDVVSNHDSRNYVLQTPYCCKPEHFNDYECASNLIPDDDPVFRYTHHRCLNMTRPWTYQSKGCIARGSSPERISEASPMMDLSVVYGAYEDLKIYRTLTGGLFKYELKDGKAWPLSFAVKDSVCSGNIASTETRCHDVPDKYGANSLGPINMFFMWFWRLHNVIAKKLSEVNPCWCDEKLFVTARDINIAVMSQIYYYELMPSFLGGKSLVDNGIISDCDGFRDVYDDTVMPGLFLEFPYALRWLHTMQEGSLNMYNREGVLVDKFPVVNLTLRTGFFFNDDNLAKLTIGSIKQACADADNLVDPDISEVGFGYLQQISDIVTSDLAKSRYYGLQPYVKYREYCSGKRITCWEDLEDVIDPKHIENLKNIYADVEDLELLAGMWVEDYVPKSTAPHTFHCIMTEQLHRYVVSDRHWYERKNRPNAFTSCQLSEIRKATMSWVLCETGDGISEIQPNAFLRHGPGNKVTECCNIEAIDFTKWEDCN